MAERTWTSSKDAVMGRAIGEPHFSGWNGRDRHLQVGGHNNRRYRAVIDFAINFSAMTSIQSATLHLTAADATANHDAQTAASTDVKIAEVTASWGEGSIDPGEGNLTSHLDWHWDNRHDRWTGPLFYTDVVQGSQGNVNDYDVTDIVTRWFNGRPNRGFIVMNDSSEDNDAVTLLYFSSDHDDFDNRPRLTIVYNNNSAPTAPTNLSPTGDEVVNTLLPVFSFTHADPDANDFITLRNVEVYADAVTDPDTATTAQKTWTAVAVAVPGAPNSLSVTFGDALVNKTYSPLIPGEFYKWRVQTADRGGLWSPFTTLQRFKVNAQPNSPVICVLPTPLSDMPSLDPTVTVTHVSPDLANGNMYGYTVIVEVESAECVGDWELQWTSGDVDTTGSPEPSKTITIGTLEWGGSYRVRARTKDSAGAWSSYSPNITFIVHKTPAPINLSPSNGESVKIAPYFTGTRGSDKDTITSFWVRVYSGDLSFMTLASTEYTDDIVGGAVFDVLYAGSALTAGTTYQWQARVNSTVGGLSDWSALQEFEVVVSTVPSISAPLAENNWTITPTITLSRASSFDRVQFEIYPETSSTDNLGTVHYASGTLSSGIGAGGLGTQYSAAYSGTALVYGTGYKIRARVSSDGGSNWSEWSGMSWFQTGTAGTPVLTSVAGDTDVLPYIIDLTPDLAITRTASDTIALAQFKVYNDTGTTLIWDSGMVDVADAITATVTYSGSELIPGTTYSWTARYTNTSSRIGAYAPRKQFRLNGVPNVPTQLSPANGHVFTPTDNWIFQAFYSDPDSPCFMDNPTAWDIEIQEIDETPFDIEVITSNLVPGLNSVQWPGSAFITDDEYRWRTRFSDGDGYGPWSAWQSFSVAEPPNGTITIPTDGSTISSVTPTVSWSFSGGTQWRYTLEIDRTNSDGVKVNDVALLGPYYGTETSKQIDAGYFQDGRYYDITLTVWNTAGLADPTPSTVNVFVVLDAPYSITGLNTTVFECAARVYLEWGVSVLKSSHTWICYRIYRKRPFEQDWINVGEVVSQTTPFFDDWYAGIAVDYEYRVVGVTTKSGVNVEMESPDDPNGGSYATANIDSDSWAFIGADRSPAHCMCINVTDEGHNRPIQQEVFETLGSNRKVIMRGFVLGHEGSVTTFWQNIDTFTPEDSQQLINETALGRRLVDYLTFNAGPHILKSPFGDVWDAQFLSPTYTWQPVGHLEVVLEYIETGQTSREQT